MHGLAPLCRSSCRAYERMLWSATRRIQHPHLKIYVIVAVVIVVVFVVVSVAAAVGAVVTAVVVVILCFFCY